MACPPDLDTELQSLRQQVASLSARVVELEHDAQRDLPSRVRELIEAAPFGSHLYELGDADPPAK